MSLLLAATSGGGTAYADNLSVGIYVLTGKTVTDSHVISDALSVGTYSVIGKSITDVYAHTDTLSKGFYTFTGLTVTDCEMTSASNAAVAGTGITVLRCNIHTAMQHCIYLGGGDLAGIRWG